jgi:hypothetical protein
VTSDGAHKKIENERSVYYHLVVKFFKQDTAASATNLVASQPINEDLRWKKMLTQFPFLDVSALFTSLPSEIIIDLIAKAKKTDPLYNAPDFGSYYHIACTRYIDPDELITGILKFEWVELAYVQGGVCNTSNGEPGHDNPWNGYFNPSPEGIDVRFAWNIRGGKGNKKIGFIDIEQGWTVDRNFFNVDFLPLTGVNLNAYGEHGAAVLQIIMNKGEATNNAGIVPDAKGYVISQWRPDGKPNEADAILSAVFYLGYGDVLLLETQAFHHNTGNKLWPVEIYEANFQAIRLATALGIIVIEAAGNGDLYSRTGNDLDLLIINDEKILCLNDGHFRDSGAIMVAASTGCVPHSRMPGSNFGSRVDCFASGRPGKKLNGTSGSSAVIAGAALSIQSIYESKYDARIGPRKMKNYLSNENLGTVSINGSFMDKIGIMPDLKKIISVL